MDCADRIAQMMSDEQEPLLIVPSHGRADRVFTHRWMPTVPICVAESQEAAYRLHNPDAELLVHPDSVMGIAPKRQWLLDRWPKVMMFDDDLKCMVDLSAPPGEEARIYDEDRVRDMVRRLYDMADVMGAGLVGFSSYGDPTLYRPHKPFALTGFIAGHAIGMIRDDRMKLPNKVDLLTDDLYSSAMNAFVHRKCLRDDRYGFQAMKTWKATGGMAAHRTWDRVLSNEKYLQGLFGDAIVRRKDSPRSTLTVEVQLTIRVPW